MTNLLNTIEMDFEYNGVQFEGNWKHNAYTVELTHNGVTEEFDWKQGMGIYEEPELERILESLMLDIHYYEEDIYSMYEDEEQAEKIIEQLKGQTKKVNKLFTDEEQGELVEYFE
ncbi:hypothetical protein vBSauClo6_154 [Staphylococcus phage vB_Sau_Clo6]|nr:hypothetical protein vBSauClo6_154 [Staphylococcus phage vB_Sau_Clo6]